MCALTFLISIFSAFLSFFPTYFQYFFYTFFLILKPSKSPIKHSRNNQTIECDQRLNEMLWMGSNLSSQKYRKVSIRATNKKTSTISQFLSSFQLFLLHFSASRHDSDFNPHLTPINGNYWLISLLSVLHWMLLIILSGHYASFCVFFLAISFCSQIFIISYLPFSFFYDFFFVWLEFEKEKYKLHSKWVCFVLLFGFYWVSGEYLGFIVVCLEFFIWVWDIFVERFEVMKSVQLKMFSNTFHFSSVLDFFWSFVFIFICFEKSFCLWQIQWNMRT